MADNRPIGFFDSGIGGLSVMLELRAMLPNESILYFADTGNNPYGPRSPEEIRELASAATEFLLAKGAKLIVVACNTASVVALAWLREHYQVPFIGMVPAVKQAALTSLAGKVGVMATTATLQGAIFDELVQRFASDVLVVRQACPGLATVIEQGKFTDPETTALLQKYVQPLLEAEVDTVVLGCTHYVFVRNQIQALLGPAVTVIDSGYAVARQTSRILHDHGLASDATVPQTPLFYTTGEVKRVKTIITNLTGELNPSVFGVPHLKREWPTTV